MKNLMERTGQVCVFVHTMWGTFPSHIRLGHKMLGLGLLLILGVTVYAATHQQGDGFVIVPAMITAVGGTLIWSSLSILECRD